MAVTVTKQAQEKGLKAGALVKEIAAKMCIRDSNLCQSNAAMEMAGNAEIQ